jgi:hypothetical protein
MAGIDFGVDFVGKNWEIQTNCKNWGKISRALNMFTLGPTNTHYTNVYNILS